jgi:L-asparaginase
MKRLLLVATGGTIASRPGEDGLSPQITSEELISCIPEVSAVCAVETLQLFNLDSIRLNGFILIPDSSFPIV